MRKQLFTALLFAGAIAVLPVGGMTKNWVVSATSNTNAPGPSMPAGTGLSTAVEAQLTVSNNTSGVSQTDAETAINNVKTTLNSLTGSAITNAMLSTQGKDLFAKIDAMALVAKGKTGTGATVAGSCTAAGITAASQVKVVGACMNEISDVPQLTVSAAASTPAVPAGYGDKVVMLNFEMANITAYKYPIMITVPTPDGFDKSKLVVLHFKDGGYEVLQPKFSGVNQSEMSFCTTSFSTYAYVQRQAVSGGGNESDFVKEWINELVSEVSNAKPGAIVRWKDVTTLPNDVMKALLAKKTVTLVMEYTYEGRNYVITIPAGAAVDNDIPWYGPMYLAARYGNGSVPAAAGGSAYVVKAGDTLSVIAKANNMSLAQLASKNPQIQNIDLILVGQMINLQ